MQQCARAWSARNCSAVSLSVSACVIHVSNHPEGALASRLASFQATGWAAVRSPPLASTQPVWQRAAWMGGGAAVDIRRRPPARGWGRRRRGPQGLALRPGLQRGQAAQALSLRQSLEDRSPALSMLCQTHSQPLCLPPGSKTPCPLTGGSAAALAQPRVGEARALRAQLASRLGAQPADIVLHGLGSKGRGIAHVAAGGEGPGPGEEAAGGDATVGWGP